MYGNNYGYYNPNRNIGVPNQPMNNQFMQQPVQMPMNNYAQQPIQQPGLQSGLQGKIVDNVEVVKATDIPLDGSVSYFPLTDGSAIVTKKLGINGSSEIVVFKPVNEQKESVKYITSEELEKSLKNIDLSQIDDIKDDIKDIKSDLKDIQKKIKGKSD